MNKLCRGFVTLLAATIIVSGMSFLPVYAEGSEAAESSTPEEMMMEDTDIIETDETEGEMTNISDEQSGSDEYVIYQTQNDETGTHEVDLRDKTQTSQGSSYSIVRMRDLVSLFGASNVSVVSDTEIKLLKNISIPTPNEAYCHFYGTFIIDFNGHTLTGIVCLQADDGSDLTLKDSSGKNTGGVINIPGRDEDGNIQYSIYTVVCQGGKVTIKSGRYSGFSTSIVACEGELRIEGGNIKGGTEDGQGSYSAIEIFSSMGEMEITGGQFYGDWYAVYCSKDHFAQRETSEPARLRISGGSFTTKGTNPASGAIAYVDGGTDQIPDIGELFADKCYIIPGKIYEYYDASYDGTAFAYTGPKVIVTQDISGIENFVTRLYTKVLGRNPDPDGKSNWVNQLVSGNLSGSDAAFGFFFSPELTKRNLSNKDFISLLYNVFFDREPDDGGMQTWLSALETGASRKYVFSGFANSQEWKNLCGSYGIEPGTYTSDEARDQNIRVTAFVQRLYTLCLDRGADADGLNNWTAALNSKSQDGAHVAYGFFFSQEFLGRNSSNADYVEVLYKVLLGRDSDPAGKADWVNQLDAGTDRMDIFRGFVHSQEFDQICADYGIVRGSI